MPSSEAWRSTPGSGSARRATPTIFCVLLKVVAARPVDLADAVELLRLHQARVDKEYLRACAERLGVGDALREALKAAEGPEPAY